MIEMLLVLMMLSFLLLLLPILHQRKQSLSLQMALLKEHLLIVQANAMRDGKTIKAYFDGKSLRYDDTAYDLDMYCNGYILFHPNGNVDHAKTLICHSNGKSGELIIQLGSGRMYVK